MGGGGKRDRGEGRKRHFADLEEMTEGRDEKK